MKNTSLMIFTCFDGKPNYFHCDDLFLSKNINIYKRRKNCKYA